MTPQKCRKILIIDDECDLADVLALRLRAAGDFEVATAMDGQEGMEKTASFKPDIILLDIAMPKMDGWEFCRRLRADPATRNIPVVIMTAWLSNAVHKEAASARFSRLLFKPFDPNELVLLLRSDSLMYPSGA